MYKKNRFAAIISVTLIISMMTVFPAFAATSKSKTKTVYAVSSWKTVHEDSKNSKRSSVVSLTYTKNGLLKTLKTKGKKEIAKYKYKGKRLKKVVRGEYSVTFNYKKGKLRSATRTWTPSNPTSTVYYVKNGKQVSKDIYDSESRNFKLSTNSRGRVLHKKDVRYTDKGYPLFGSETLDEHGFPVYIDGKVTEDFLESLKYFGGSSLHVGDVVEDKAINTYDKTGKLKKIVYKFSINGETRSKTTVTIKYKKIRIPSSYSKTFDTQQYDILFFFADPFGKRNFQPESTPIGFGKVSR